MDYKIKLEATGIGKQASAVRNKVLQAQKSAAGKRPADDKARERTQKDSIQGVKALTTSIQKLISSNKELINAVNKMSGGGGGGGRPGGGGGGGGATGAGAAGGRAGGSTFKAAGAAALGYAGWAVSKINQIGSAYIEKTGAQAGSVGIGGFRRGQGMYDAAGIGAGMKAYGQATGKFQANPITRYYKDKKTGKMMPYQDLNPMGSPDQTAMNVGAIYGLSAEETLRTAGQFKRAGGNYAQAANVGAGSGIESELPILLTGMADILTDAVKNGINTSDMSKDLASEISAMTAASPGKSVDAAMNLIKSFAGTKKDLGAGKMNTVKGLYMAKATQDIMVEKITGAGGATFLKEQFEKKRMTPEEYARIEKLRSEGKFKTYDDLAKNAPISAMGMLRGFGEEVSIGAQSKKMRDKALIDWKVNENKGGRQALIDHYLSTGFVSSQSAAEQYINTRINPEDTETKGRKIIEGRGKAVVGSASGQSAARNRGQENLLLDAGAEFATTAMNMERSMQNLAREAIPLATNALILLAKAANMAANPGATMGKGVKKLSQIPGDIAAGAADLYDKIVGP